MSTKKSIVIFQENNPPISLTDEDERSREDYAKSLSNFMRFPNVSILVTSNSAVIIKPSRINSIHIEEYNVIDEVPQEQQLMQKTKPTPAKTAKKKPAKKKEKIKQEMDIITDVD